MKTSRKELIETLAKLRPGLNSKDRVDQSSSFVFSGGQVVTYNESFMILANSPVDLTGAVRADELLALLNKLSQDEVELDCSEGQLKIKAGRSKAGIKFEDEVRIPVAEVMADYEQGESHTMPKELLPALAQARFCASRSMNDLRFTAIEVDSGYVTATDGYRIMSVAIKGAKKLPRFLLPAAAVEHLIGYDPIKVTISASWAFFANAADVLFCCRLINDESQPFPDVEPMLHVEGPELFLPEAIIDALDKADIFTKSAQHETDRFVELSLKSGRVTVKGEGAFGWYEEAVPAKDYTGEPVSFAVHPEFLRGILPLVRHAVLGKNTVLFSGENFDHVFVQSKRPVKKESSEE